VQPATLDKFHLPIRYHVQEQTHQKFFENARKADRLLRPLKFRAILASLFVVIIYNRIWQKSLLSGDFVILPSNFDHLTRLDGFELRKASRHEGQQIFQATRISRRE
jgi:hypothetical protein